MKRLIALLPALLLPALALAQEKVALKLSYAPGDFDMKMAMKMDGVTHLSVGATTQPAMEQKMTMLMTARMSVSAPDQDGVKKASLTYTRIAQHITAGPIDFTYDSDDANTAGSPIAGGLKVLVGAKIGYEIGADGNVRSITGLDEIWTQLAKENPAMEKMAEQFKKDFGSEQIQNMMAGAAAGYLPAQPVAVGESWQRTMKMQAPVIGPMTLEAGGKLVGVKGGLADVDIESKGTIDKPTEAQMGGVNATVEKMDVSQKGRFVFDHVKGMVTSASIQGEVRMNMTMPGPGEQKVTSSSKQSTQTEITVTEAKPTPAPAK